MSDASIQRFGTFIMVGFLLLAISSRWMGDLGQLVAHHGSATAGFVFLLFLSQRGELLRPPLATFFMAWGAVLFGCTMLSW